jgi:hypothetical protein
MWTCLCSVASDKRKTKLLSHVTESVDFPRKLAVFQLIQFTLGTGRCRRGTISSTGLVVGAQALLWHRPCNVQAIIRLGIGHAMLWNRSCCGTGHNTFWYKPCYVVEQVMLWHRPCCGTGHNTFRYRQCYVVEQVMLWHRP